MDLKQSFEFFKELHKNQKYSDGAPYWPHLLRVGLLVKNTLEINKEGSKKEKEIITIAAFGHDSLEDTNVTENILRKKFGEEITKIILGMTNHEGDAHTSRYVSQVCSSDEKVRLIKLADICINLMRIMHSGDDKIFLKSKILPIMQPMHKRIIKTKFTKYGKSAGQLIELSELLMGLTKNFLN